MGNNLATVNEEFQIQKLKSNKEYNDGEWHLKVPLMHRRKKKLKLNIGLNLMKKQRSWDMLKEKDKRKRRENSNGGLGGMVGTWSWWCNKWERDEINIVGST